ncbi:speckle-type POZ protein-like [Argiope bruennichi]|uniref:Speckle-type POZ protein like n=1 Tax=Argiope bruennichi TaxID=94029 RepID=A0A8T0F987_ARGBR|nr:speckle-type POZ protein-like [Argiope bruennichi]KAF8786932.1 Speckle-type POZ protein like [Argiope bruennichi]
MAILHAIYVCFLNYVIATWSISIVAADGFSHFSEERINQKFPSDAYSGVECVVKRQEIFANKTFYLPKDTLTIRCEIKRRLTEKPLIKYCNIRSEVGIKHISVPWDIKHFSSLQLKQPLNFPLLLNLAKEPNFEIHVYVDGDFLDSSHVQIDIKKISLKGNTVGTSSWDNYGCSIKMRCEVSIMDSKGIPSLTVEGMRFFNSCANDELWHLPEIAKRIDLRTKKDLYLPDDVLSLRFELAVSSGGMQSLPAETRAIYPELQAFHCYKPFSTMKNDFKLLFQEQKLCDITLKTASKTFKAHKAVLSCRSPVFKAMFECDIVENSSGIVNISDIDSKILEQMLFFMYADQIEDTMDPRSVMKLYCAADKYQIHTLKECCYPILKSLISAEHVCELLPLAYKYHDETLKIIAKAFVCKHPSETLESDGWEKLMEDHWSGPGQIPFTTRSPEAILKETKSTDAATDENDESSDAESDENDVTMPNKKRKV